MLAEGIDPSEQRKATKHLRQEARNNSFENIAREWWLKKSPSWSLSHKKKVIGRLEQYVFPWMGSSPISDINAPEVLAVLRRIEVKGIIETAHRVRGECSQIFRYAIATGRAERDVCADLRGALSPVKTKHLAALTEPADVGRLLLMLDQHKGSFPVNCALRLAPMLFVRPGELRQAMWADINLDDAEWRYIVTKTETQHIVPLSTQAVEILRELYPLTQRSPYVFPNARTASRPMSENAVNYAMRGLGIPSEDMCGHGFRAMARTILDEVLGFRPDYIEHQLAHAVRDPNGRAYNRTAHLAERTKMMQAWADYLDNLKAQAISAS